MVTREDPVRITINGQVTIPQAIRERYGLLPGAEVRFVEDDDVVRIERAEAPPSRGSSIVDAMRAAARRRKAPQRLTTDEIMALTRTSVGEEPGAEDGDWIDALEPDSP